MYYKCSVDNCPSKRHDVILHHFPASATLARKWLQCIGSDRLNGLDLQSLRKMFICHKHFEAKFLTAKNRIRLGAYPSLFTESEIASGLPEKAAENIMDLKTDHCYFKTRHEDHTYYNKLPESLKRGIITNNDHIYSRERHNDHCYALQEPESVKNSNIADRAPNRNANELNAPLSNNEKDVADTGESNVNEKTVADFRKSRTFESHPYAEGIPDFDDYDEPLQGSKSAQDPVFSWEKNVEVVPADDGDVACLGTETLADIPTEISLYCDDDSTPANVDSDKSPEYQCNECKEIITGFRYTCVQCADWDLCAACEARAAHDAHYVLRVPGHRPYSEIQAVLAAIRQQILSENLFLNPVDDSLKMEIKSEPDEVSPDAEIVPPSDLDPLPETDPLGGHRPDSEHSFIYSSEDKDSDSDSGPSRAGTPDEPFTETEHLLTISSDDSDASLSPRRKRMRRIPTETYKTASVPRIQPEEILPGPSNTETQTATLQRQVKKVPPHKIPKQYLSKDDTVTSEPQAELAYNPVVRFETPTRSNQRAMSHKQPERIQPTPVTLFKVDQGRIEEGTESVAHKTSSSLSPYILKRGSPRKRLTDEAKENSEQQLNEPPPFYIRLPPGTDEETLIQALQCQATVRLKRDF